MTYKAYIDNIRAKTGKTPGEFLALATKKGFVKNGKVLVKHAMLLTWLKTEMKLGHGHANAIIMYLRNPDMAMKKIAEDAKHEKAK